MIKQLIEPERLLTAIQLAEVLGVSVRTIANFRTAGVPCFVRSVYPLYAESVVRDWLERQPWVRASIKPPKT